MFTFKLVGETTAIICQDGRKAAVATFDGEYWICDVHFRNDLRMHVTGHRAFSAPTLERLVRDIAYDYSTIRLAGDI